MTIARLVDDNLSQQGWHDKSTWHAPYNTERTVQ